MSRNVLVVDDVRSLRQEIVFLLEDEDHTPFEAENGKLAIEVLNKEPIDLLITDVMMPEMDGIELSKYCRNKLPDLKIIIISGGGVLKADDSDKSDDMFSIIKKLNIADEVLKKPFDYDELISAIERLI